MTESEFKQWFTGFTEATDGAQPTKKQWEKIKERIDQITGVMTSHTVFRDYYWRPYYQTYPYVTHTFGYNSVGDAAKMGVTTCGTNMSGAAQNASNFMSLASSAAGGIPTFAASGGTDGEVSYEAAVNMDDAMYALGKADALAE